MMSALTAPVVASHISTSKGVRSVVYTAGIKGVVFALDAETGEQLWERQLRYAVLPGKWQYQSTFTNGPAPHGSLMAFKVVADPKTQAPVLEPVWVSGDFDLPDPAVIANGVVFAVATGSDEVQRGGTEKRVKAGGHAVLKALDLKTGKELFNSETTITSWVHFSGLAVSDARVFAVDHDSNVYCFGLR
jgi:outer membrane protein assembly factor BamB